MPALTITGLRADILRAVKAGNVQRHRGWTVNEKTRDVWQVNDHTKKTVTKTCNDLSAPGVGLIRPGRTLGRSIYSPQVWELTEAGEKALAEHDARQTAGRK